MENFKLELDNPDLLCPAIVTETTVPLLSNAPSKEEASDGQTVTLTACSEYKKFVHFAGHFDAMHNLHFVHDGEHQPMVFTILTNSRLYCIHHVSGDSWKTYDITPGSDDAIATAFHVLQLSDDRVAIAVVVNTPSSASGKIQNLCYAEPFDPKSRDFNPKSIGFRKIDNINGPVTISTVNLGSDESMSSCFILVGVMDDNTDAIIDFIVIPGSSNEGDWRRACTPYNATKVLKTLSVTLSGPYNGYTASLYKKNSTLDDFSSDDPDVGSGVYFSGIDRTEGFNVPDLNLCKTGGARDITMTVTPSKVSDIYVAGVKGIGYYANEKLGTNKDPMVILGDISFKQVVASEKKEMNSKKSRIIVFAVSTDGGLYFIEGIRDGNDALPTFSEAVEAPIRRDIGFLSAQYNPGTGASEVVYVNAKGQKARHMLRDPTSSLWSERTVYIERDNKGTMYDAFETRVSLKGNSGAILGAGYPMMISSSELAYVLVNDKSYSLSKTQTPVMTDSSGSVTVVIETDVTHSSPILHFTVQGKGKSQTINVDPRQRITSQWSKYTSGADLKNAKSTTGEPIFADTTIPDSTFNDVSLTLQEISKVLLIRHSSERSAAFHSVSNAWRPGMTTFGNANISFESFFEDAFKEIEQAAGSAISAVTEAAEKVADTVKETAEKVADTVKETAEKVADEIEEVADEIGGAVRRGVGTVTEATEQVVDTVIDAVKSGISVANGVVNFVATVGGKAYRWVLDASGTIVTAVIACLKDTLGLDTTRFFALFGFLWDHENIVNTQKIIADSAVKGVGVLKDVIPNKVSSLKDCIKGVRSSISKYVEDKRILERDETINWTHLSSSLEDSPPGKFLKAFIHNPIVNEVLNLVPKWIQKASSLFDDVISLPGAEAITKLSEKLTEIVGKLLKLEAKNLLRFIDDVIAKVKDLLAGRLKMGEFFSVVLSDAFWTVFDAIEDVIEAFIDILSDLIGAVLDMCTGPIKIPAVSSFWKAVNDTDFSILNVLSMSIAQIAYLVTMIWKGKLPFDLMPRWDTFLPDTNSRVKLFETRRKPQVSKTRGGPNQWLQFEDFDNIQIALAPASGSPAYYYPQSNVKFSPQSNVKSSPQSSVSSAEIGFTILSSIAVMIATMTQFGSVSVSGDGGPAYGERESFGPEFLTREVIPFIDGAPSPLETSPAPNIKLKTIKTYTQICFNGTSLISEVVLLFIGWSSNEYNRWFKSLSVLLKGIDVIVLFMKTRGGSVGAALSTISNFTPILSPIGNVLNAICGFIDYDQSTKNSADRAALAVSITGFIAATCDGLSVVIRQPQVKAGFYIVSFGTNIGGSCGGIYAIKLKNEAV